MQRSIRVELTSRRCYRAEMTETEARQQRGSRELWLQTAQDMLCVAGVDAVRVQPLAKKLGLSRTGFYWHFKDRNALLDALINNWEAKNTDNLVARADAYAANICEAVFNLFDCWLDPDLFDAPLELAIRSWSRRDNDVRDRLESADQKRRAAIETVFIHFGYAQTDAEMRATALLHTQVGFVSLQFPESNWKRLARVPDYVEVFTGQRPSENDVGRFMSRHLVE